VRGDGGRTYSVYFQGRYVAVEGGEQEAIAKQAELRGKAARGEKPVVPTKLTFSVVAEEWFAGKRKLRPYTRKNYRSYLDRILIPRLGSKKIGAISVEDIARLIRALENDGLSPSTIMDYMKPLTGTLALALRRGYIAVNPCSLLTRDDRPAQRQKNPDHVWSDEEIESLIGAAERMAHKPEARYDYAPLIRTALYTGLRIGELLGLQWQDVDLQEDVLHVRRQWTRTGEYGPTKSNAAIRDIPLSDEMTKYLAALKLRSRYARDDDPVFASKIGRPFGHRNATRRGFEPAAKLAEIDGISFHSMRHAFASRMIARGIEPVTLAKLMGHEDARITLSRYAHVYDKRRTDDAVRKAMAW
jgi:integrase